MSRKKKIKAKPNHLSQASALNNKLDFFSRVDLFLEKSGKWLILAGWMAFLVLYLSLATDELGAVLGGDNARYLMLAKSLAEGKGYRDLLFFEEPSHTQYPFLFPLLISPFALSARQVFYTHIFIQIIGSVIPLLVAGWARLQGESRLRALLIFFLVGSLPAYFSFLLNILTEILFMFFMFSALFLLSYTRVKGFDLFKILIFSILVLASALTREQGLVLFSVFFLAIILDSKFRKVQISGIPFWLIFAGVFVMGYGLWTLRNIMVGEGGFYFKQFLAKNPYLPQLGNADFADFLQRLKTNSYLHIPHLAGFAFPSWLFPNKESALKFSLSFFSLIVLGIAFRLKNKNLIAELSFLALFSLAMLWFFKEERFSFAIIPLAPFYFLKGLDWLKKIIKGFEPVILALLAGLTIWQFTYTAWLAYKYHQKLIYPREPVFVEGYGEWEDPAIDLAKYYLYWQKPEEYNIPFSDWIILQKVAGKILPPDAVIISRKAPITWFYSGRKSNWYKMGVNSEDQWKYLKQNHATHLLIMDNPELINLIKQYPDNFQFIAGIKRSSCFLVKIISYP